MKNLYFTFLFTLLNLPLFAQIDQISLGNNYASQSYYSIEEGTTITIDPTSWDIAFALGGQDAGVFVNESVASSFTTPLPQVELFLTSASDFTNVDTTDMVRIYNNEVSWSEGAFNHVKDENDIFDQGWGLYESSTNSVTSSRFFVIKLRNETYKKLEIQSLIAGIYTFRYANLDGTEETSQTIDKTDYNGKTLAYFSIENNEALDIEPEEWDFLFTRYAAILDDGNGGFIDYIVSGILTNKGVEVAQANGVDPENVEWELYQNDFSDSLDIIGHDWKSFDLDEFAWVIPEDQVYFVLLNDNELWKIQWLDFEGSSTGTATLEKTFVTTITAVSEVFESLLTFDIYPNPAVDYIKVTFDLDSKYSDGTLQITNNLGQVVSTQYMSIPEGLHTEEMILDLPTGIYFLSIVVGDQFISKPVYIK